YEHLKVAELAPTVATTAPPYAQLLKSLVVLRARWKAEIGFGAMIQAEIRGQAWIPRLDAHRALVDRNSHRSELRAFRIRLVDHSRRRLIDHGGARVVRSDRGGDDEAAIRIRTAHSRERLRRTI